MIRALALPVLLVAFVLPALAQNTPSNDMSFLRGDPALDFDVSIPMTIQQTIAATEDTSWFETFPATSTITQAVVRRYMVTQGRTLELKAIEINRAIRLANAFTADEIMSIYAQRIYLGARCYGFADALQFRLGVALTDATYRDAATLAALIRGPQFMEQRPERWVERYELIANTGAEAGFWPQETAEAMILAGPKPLIAGSICPE